MRATRSTWPCCRWAPWRSRSGPARSRASAAISPALPEVAAIGEIAALKEVDVTVWFGLLAPAGVDATIVNRVHKEVAEILQDPAMKAKFADLGMQAIGAGPQQFATFMQGEQKKFAKIVKDRNIRAE
ncbi:MAG: hypothetical protein EOO24_44835 [Comamonadaceae bacterium]|nr:MAG: hypothetical protein EOO24_44835 [Comamonadaceae bacterium]